MNNIQDVQQMKLQAEDKINYYQEKFILLGEIEALLEKNTRLNHIVNAYSRDLTVAQERVNEDKKTIEEKAKENKLLLKQIEQLKAIRPKVAGEISDADKI